MTTQCEKNQKIFCDFFHMNLIMSAFNILFNCYHCFEEKPVHEDKDLRRLLLLCVWSPDPDPQSCH